MGFLGNIGRGGGVGSSIIGRLIGNQPEPPPQAAPPSPNPGMSWRDGFANPAPRMPDSLVGNVPQEPPRPVEDLVPDLQQFEGGEFGSEFVAERFSSDLPVMSNLLRHPKLSNSENAQRVWAFFMAYAEVAAQFADLAEGPGLEAFQQALQKHGFGELKDVKTGKDLVATAAWVLQGGSPEGVRQRGAEVLPQSTRPDAPTHSPSHSSALDKEGPGDKRLTGERPAQRSGALQELAHAIPGPVGNALRRMLRRRTPEEEEEERWRKRREGSPYGFWEGLEGRLGSNMLWNTLHRLRKPREHGSVAESEWNRIVFMAVGALVAITVIIIILVNL